MSTCANVSISIILKHNFTVDKLTLRFFTIVFSIFRVPQPYQYSALSQFDNDPDEEINDLDDHLEMLVEDSSSEDLEEEENQNQAKEIKADSNEVENMLF